MRFKPGQSGNPAGRPKGAKSKKTIARDKALADGITPLEYLESIYQDENADPKMRLEAAKSAASFVHPKLSSVDVTNHEPDQPVEEIGTDELQRIATGGSKRDSEAQSSATEPDSVH